MEQLENRHDPAGKRLLQELNLEIEEPTKEHLGERAYAEDWWLQGEKDPTHTAFSMDAPTEKQFDVPVQHRNARDPVKALDNAKKWSSKIMGLMIAGALTCFVCLLHVRSQLCELICAQVSGYLLMWCVTAWAAAQTSHALFCILL